MLLSKCGSSGSRSSRVSSRSTDTTILIMHSTTEEQEVLVMLEDEKQQEEEVDTAAAAAAAAVVTTTPVQQQQQQQQIMMTTATTSKEQSEMEATSQMIQSRLKLQLQKMRLKDQTSKQLTKEDLMIIYEDETMLVVNKPSGVLTVPGKDKSLPSLAQFVYDYVSPTELSTPDHMVVHRLGMDTSGLILLAKTKAAVREFNGLFRERKVHRKYEALVVGHIMIPPNHNNNNNVGMISLPIMRDYERPPYVRISTDAHQWKLMDLDPDQVGKKMLERPKSSITKYEVISREFLSGQPVTRVLLTSISGRYHQLNVHMAAFGHPIVGDNIYGPDGEALPNGGLQNDEFDTLIPNPHRATLQEQRLVNEIAYANHMPPCVHAKYIQFQHRVTKKQYEFQTNSPF